MAGSARWAAVELTSLFSLLGLSLSVDVIILEVVYPEAANYNYSYVKLTCLKNLLDPLDLNERPATFWRGVSQITYNSDLVTDVVQKIDVSITFDFNQNQEGSFSCKTALGEASNAKKLAGTLVIASLCKLVCVVFEKMPLLLALSSCSFATSHLQ